MQAIMETSFDVVYLISVITIGILMVAKAKGNKEYTLFGIMAITLGAGDAFHLVPRAVALCTTGLENFTVALGIGKFITSITMTVFYILLSHQRTKGCHHRRLSAVRSAHPAVPLPAERLDQRRCTAELGYPAQHPVCTAGSADYRPVLSERQEAQRPQLWLDVADHCAQLRFLHPGRPVGRYHPDDWNADDSKDLRLCLDCLDWFFGHEACSQGIDKDKTKEPDENRLLCFIQ